MESSRKVQNRHRNSVTRELARNKTLYLMMLPGILYFLVFNYLPLAGVYYAFVDYKPMAGLYGLASRFVGFENFKYFFASGTWVKITVNTLYLNALFITTGIFMQLIMAVLLNEVGNRYFRKTAQSLMFLPNFLSWTVVSVFALALFGFDDGLINSAISAIGLSRINFYQQAGPWPFLLVLLKLWKGVGYGTVIYLASISGISQELYEAARVDGATKFQQMRFITIPMLKTTTIVLLVLAVGSIFFGDFGMIYALLGDNPLVRPTTDVIDTFVYRALRTQNDIGMSTAVGLLQSVLGVIMALAANYTAKKIDKDYQVF